MIFTTGRMYLILKARCYRKQFLKPWEKPKRHALAISQQKAFMDFLKQGREYEGWLPVVMVLPGTGIRIEETEQDLTFTESWQ